MQLRPKSLTVNLRSDSIAPRGAMDAFVHPARYDLRLSAHKIIPSMAYSEFV